MFREGIGEGSFAGYHPWVNLTYYIFAVGLTILTLSPWFLAATFVMAWVYSLLLRGTEVLKINLILSLWIFVIMGALLCQDPVDIFHVLFDRLPAVSAGILSAVHEKTVVLQIGAETDIPGKDLQGLVHRNCRPRARPGRLCPGRIRVLCDCLRPGRDVKRQIVFDTMIVDKNVGNITSGDQNDCADHRRDQFQDLFHSSALRIGLPDYFSL